eukprot:UN01892
MRMVSERAVLTLLTKSGTIKCKSGHFLTRPPLNFDILK